MSHRIPEDVQTLVALLRHRSANDADRDAFVYLHGAGGATTHWTYEAIDRRARAVAATLQRAAEPGDRVMLLFDEGLDYLAALFGCMYAGALACPCHPPDPQRLDRTLPRLQQIASNAGVSVVLTSSDLAAKAAPLKATLGPLSQVAWISVDEIRDDLANEWVAPELQPDSIAYLQYTSGSTSHPKGVMVSHRNLLHQLRDFDTGYDHSKDGTLVSWLPATHDLGLVYGRFMPIYVGMRCVFMSPATFMRTPSLWMETMSTWRGTHSPSPNFGYEIATLKTPSDVIERIDLRHVKVLLNGAEPIRREAEEEFLKRFGRAGLPPQALTHAMGMSEATAKILTEPIARTPGRFLDVDADAYESHVVHIVERGTPNARTIASCGATLLDTRCEIVDPSTSMALPDDRVGELWVKGTTVAQGYWAQPEVTRETFRATLASGEGPFLRTGDFAFRHDGEIYLAGRLKDLIILRGQNFHPHDLEWPCVDSHPAIRPNGVVAFGLEADGGEQLAVLAEVYPDRLGRPDAIFAALRAALGDVGVAPHTLALTAPRALAKTSSGKPQRHRIRTQYLQREIPLLASWQRADEAPAASTSDGTPRWHEMHPQELQEHLVDTMCDVAARLLGVEGEDIDPDRPFRELGLDSVTLVEWLETISAQLGVVLSTTALFDYPTIEEFAEHLAPILMDSERPT